VRRSVDRSDAFKNDVGEAIAYGLDSFGSKATFSFSEELDDWVDSVALYPMLGSLAENVAVGARRVRVRSYWLYYLSSETSILLLRLVRTERDVT
jgi:plasmid stabilization system protein ParE